MRCFRLRHRRTWLQRWWPRPVPVRHGLRGGHYGRRGATALTEPLYLVYTGKLPDMHRARAGNLWRVQWWFKQKVLRQLGAMPFAEKRKAHVSLTRVLGKREREMDEDKNLQFACGGLVDALVTGGYLAGDTPKQATFEFHQDATRRHEGPRIEVVVTYESREENP